MKYILEKKNSNGKLNRWTAEVIRNEVYFQWGIVGGKQQTKHDIYREGKNIGKENETSPAEQCLFETERKVRGKIEDGFILKLGTLTTTSKTVVASDLSVPNPMLAKKYQDNPAKVDEQEYILADPKLDGNRCLCNIKTAKIYSRKRKEITSIPHLGKEIQKACKGLKVTWVDGELYSDKITFNEIQSIVRKSKDVDVEKAKKIKFNIYDIINNDGAYKRKCDIEKNVEETDYVHKVDFYKIKPSEIRKYHDQFIERGYEGLMIRLINSPYEQKRSSGLLKYKIFIDEEFEIVGFKCEENKPDVLGAVTCKMKNGKTFNARPAMTVAERDQMWKNQKNYIGKMATIKFQNYDDKTGIPRFGVLKGIRDEGDLDI